MKNKFLLVLALMGFSLTSFSQLNIPDIFGGQNRNESSKQKKQKKGGDRDDDDDDRYDRNRDRRVGNGQRNLPPGQAKKIYGSKSAREHAPGQRKKQNGQYGNNGTYGSNGTYGNNGTVGNNGNYPPEVISVEDRYVQRDNQGRLYYIDQNGNVYYRGKGGKYYLDHSSVRR